MSPRITIATPTYNRAPLLAETIESIQAQDSDAFRYIVIDDGSTDGTQALVNGYPEVEYYHQENQGEAAATNRAWQMTNTEYFAMVSSDDPMKSNWLRVGIEFMDCHPELVVGYPDWEMIGSSGEHIRDVQVYEYSSEKLYGWLHCLPGAGAIIRKTAVAPEYVLRDKNLKYVSDLESWFRLGLVGPMARIPHQLATWRYHTGSTSISDFSHRRSSETIALVENFFARQDLPPEIERLRKSSLSRAHYLASVFHRHGSMRLTVQHYLRSLMLQPLGDVNLPPELRRVGGLRWVRDWMGTKLWL